MPVERTAGGNSLIDVLDRVLDKGIVLDAWVKVSLAGIDFRCVERHVVVASLNIHTKASASPLPSASPLAMLMPPHLPLQHAASGLRAPFMAPAAMGSKRPRRNKDTSC